MASSLRYAATMVAKPSPLRSCLSRRELCGVFPDYACRANDALLPSPQRDIHWTNPRLFHSSPCVAAPPPKKGALGGGSAFKAGMTITKKKFEVETDPQKLVSHLCGGQYHKEGPEIKLKPDSEYPDWLWTCRTTGPPELHELDPDTVEYWERVYEINLQNHRMVLKAHKGRIWNWRIQKRKEHYKIISEQVKRWKQTGMV